MTFAFSMASSLAAHSMLITPNIIFLISLICQILFNETTQSHIPCVPKEYGSGRIVCVCNSTYCDTIEPVGKITEGEYVKFVSSEEGLRFEKSTHSFCGGPQGEDSFLQITVSTRKCQKIFGFGGAFTDSTGINIKSLGEKTQQNLLSSYFSRKGLEYNFCRVPIGGTDFSTRPYTFDDNSNKPDPGLRNFSLALEDYMYKIPIIKQAMEMSEREIRLFSAAWSAPAWMKTNNNISGVGKLKREYYEIYPKYLLSFLDEYKRNNLSMWAISTQNEPQHGLDNEISKTVAPFNSMGWTAKELSEWVAYFMGPQLRSSIHKNVGLFTYEDQRDRFFNWTLKFAKSHLEALSFIQGWGVHWYYDTTTSPDILNKVHREFPDKFIMYTEAAITSKVNEIIGSWDNGEKYLISIIEAINARSSAWVDWNMAVNEEGGPKWDNNHGCGSPIIVNATADEFYKDTQFYAMGHVSKFIERDANCLEVKPQNCEDVLSMGVQNQNGRNVIVILNKNMYEKPISIYVEGKGWINEKIAARSMETVIC